MTPITAIIEQTIVAYIQNVDFSYPIIGVSIPFKSFVIILHICRDLYSEYAGIKYSANNDNIPVINTTSLKRTINIPNLI